MKKLLVVDFPDGLADDLLDQLLSDYPHAREATPDDVAALVTEVPWVWSSRELGGEAPVRVTLRRVRQGVQVLMPQWRDGEGAVPVPCWIDLVPHAQDAFAPVQFLFDRDNDGATVTKTLVYDDGDVEVVCRKDMALTVEPPFGDRLCAYGIAGGDQVLFLEDDYDGD